MERTAPLFAAALTLSLALHAPAVAQDLGAPEGEAPAIGVFTEPEADAAADEPAPAAPADDAQAAPETPAAPEAPAVPEGEAPAAEDEAAPAEAEAAEDEAAVPQLPQPEVLEVVRDTFDDWEVRCAPEGDDCFLYQLAHDQEGNPVAEFSLVRLAGAGDAVAGVTVVTPLGTLLPAGLVTQIDGGEARQYEFTFCSQVGCFARFGLTQDSVNRMQRGRTARLTLVSIGAPDRPVNLDLSLIGFTAGYNSLTPTQAE